MNNMESVIKLENITKQFSSEEGAALRGVNIEVKSGEFVCIIGTSGCGKSTILNIIAGLETPTSGSLKRPPKVGMVFQSGALFPWLSVLDNVAVGLRSTGLSLSEARAKAPHYIEMMHLSDKALAYPADLSGGMRQRVSIARALAANPEVLLLDEPFSALDPKTTAELHADLLDIWKKTKTTILMVSHLIEEAVTLAGRVVLIKDGVVDETFSIDLPYPRRDQNEEFSRVVLHIRKEFFK